MNKLTAEIARMDIGHLREHLANPHAGLSMREEKYLQALEIALPVLEQNGRWISCSDRIPEEAAMVLLRCDNDYDFGMLIGGEMKVFTMGEWKVLPGASITHWQPLPAPPQPQTDTYRQIENDAWIEWRGGSGKPTEVVVDVRYRDGITDVGWAYIFNWEHRKAADDIVAYRVIENDGSAK